MLLRKILELQLPMREEVEILFVKVALKPLFELEKKLKLTIQPVDKITGEIAIFSDNEEGHHPAVSSSENLFAIQPEGHTNESIDLDISLGFLSELILSLTPEQVT